MYTEACFFHYFYVAKYIYSCIHALINNQHAGHFICSCLLIYEFHLLSVKWFLTWQADVLLNEFYFFSPALFESSTPHLPEDKSGCKIDRPSTDRAPLGIRQRFPSHLAIHRVWDGELIDSWQAFISTGFSLFKSLFICCLFSICPDTDCLLRIIWKFTATCELCKFTTYRTW